MRFLRWGMWLVAVFFGLYLGLAWETLVMKSDLAFFRKAAACLKAGEDAEAVKVCAEWCQASKTWQTDPRYYAVASCLADRAKHAAASQFNRDMTVETVLGGK